MLWDNSYRLGTRADRSPFYISLTKSLEAQNSLVKSTEQLDKAVANSNENGLPPIAISPAQGQFLSILCRMTNAKSILEIGTLGGYSTIWFASVPGVHVTSIEYNEKHRNVAIENVKGLNVDILLGAALDVLPKLADEGKVFDFIFIDAAWNEQREYFDWAVKMTKKSGIIFVDNVVRQLTESEVDGDLSGPALIDHVSKDDRVDATLIPWLGTHKSRLDELVDGFVLAIVK